MPSINFLDYVRNIRESCEAVLATGRAKTLNLEVDQRSTLRGVMIGRLLFEDDSELHFREYVDLTLPQHRLMYVYHYQDADNRLVFRYDNAAHRPPLGQPEHKHTQQGISLILPPTLIQVLDAILTTL